MLNDRELENFQECSSVFIEKYESKFIEYFVSLCTFYDKTYPEETLIKVAKFMYSDIFNKEVSATSVEESIFLDMKNNGLMLAGFVITRSLFFLLKNYVEESKENHPEYSKYIVTFVSLIDEYTSQFEIRDLHNSEPIETHIDFDTFENFVPGDNIIKKFQKIKDNGEEVTFFNLYKSIPIHHSAIIVDIEDTEVSFKTMQTQGIAMKMDGVAYILKDDNFDKFVKADIVYNNFSNNTVVLKNFTYLLNMPATQREFVRVHPEIMAEVTLSAEQHLKTKGKLFDLSVDGLGVISEENNGIYAGARIELNVPLELNDSLEPDFIKLEAEVLNIIEYTDSYRYCIKIYPEPEVEKKIINYVEVREKEILNSLNEKLDEYGF